MAACCSTPSLRLRVKMFVTKYNRKLKTLTARLIKYAFLFLSSLIHMAGLTVGWDRRRDAQDVYVFPMYVVVCVRVCVRIPLIFWRKWEARFL